MAWHFFERVRQRFVEAGMEAALKCRPGAGRKQKLNGELEETVFYSFHNKSPQTSLWGEPLSVLS